MQVVPQAPGLQAHRFYPELPHQMHVSARALPLAIQTTRRMPQQRVHALSFSLGAPACDLETVAA